MTPYPRGASASTHDSHTAQIPLRIPLRRKDGSAAAYALVDADNADLLGLSWYRGSRGYAMRQYRDPTANRTQTHCELMHRRIMGLVIGDGLEVDHINRDKLDNRRSNLRVVTHAENEQNKICATGTSGYRNVVWYTSKQRYVARVKVNGKWKTKGGFLDAESASVAAEELRRRWHPCAP